MRLNLAAVWSGVQPSSSLKLRCSGVCSTNSSTTLWCMEIPSEKGSVHYTACYSGALAYETLPVRTAMWTELSSVKSRSVGLALAARRTATGRTLVNLVARCSGVSPFESFVTRQNHTEIEVWTVGIGWPSSYYVCTCSPRSIWGCFINVFSRRKHPHAIAICKTLSWSLIILIPASINTWADLSWWLCVCACIHTYIHAYIHIHTLSNTSSL